MAVVSPLPLSAPTPRAQSAQLTLALASDRSRRVRDSQGLPALLAKRAFREASKILETARGEVSR